MAFTYYVKKYKFFIFYFLFFFIPKIRIDNDIYIWPFEVFMFVFIVYFLLVGKKLIYEKTLLLSIVFFVYLFILTNIMVLLGAYDFSFPLLLRNIKMLLYFFFLLCVYSYYFEKFKRQNFVFDIVKMLCFFGSVIMLVMVVQILYHFYFYGIPETEDLLWRFSSNQRPYLFTGRYIDFDGIHDIEKGNHNATGVLATLIFFISLFLFSRNKLLLYIFYMFISIITLFMSFSRSSFVIFILMLIVYFFTGNKKIYKFLYTIVVIFVLYFLFKDLWEYTIFSKITNMVQSINDGHLEPSSLGRVNIWEFIFSFEPNYAHLIFGNGFGESGVMYFTDDRYTQMESTFLNIIIWGGVFSLLFIIFYVNLIYKARLISKFDKDLSNVLYYFLIIFILPNVFTGGDILMDAVLHFLFPIILIILYIPKIYYHENTTYHA